MNNQKQNDDRGTWRDLETHAGTLKGIHLRQLFADDPGRADRFSVEAAGIFLDFSKNRITEETLQLLLRLAEASGLADRIGAMFRGEKINTTEDRAVLHVALRAPASRSIWVDGKDVVPEVHAVLDQMVLLQTACGWERGSDIPARGSGI